MGYIISTIDAAPVLLSVLNCLQVFMTAWHRFLVFRFALLLTKLVGSHACMAFKHANIIVGVRESAQSRDFLN